MLFKRLVTDNQQLWDKCKAHYMWAKQITPNKLEIYKSQRCETINNKSPLEEQVGISAYNFLFKHQVLSLNYQESEYHKLMITFAKSLAKLNYDLAIITNSQIPSVLTIAGHDPSGGAGISADLKTFTRHQVYGASVITALTIQNTNGVSDSQALSASFVQQQLDAVLNDIKFECIKIGMLASEAIIEVVIDSLRNTNSKVILDPVIFASSKYQLLSDAAVLRLNSELLSLVTVITPNIPEAEQMLGIKIGNCEDMKKACLLLAKKGPKAVLLKGGHLKADMLTDVLYYDEQFYLFSHEHQNTKNTHGTGCTLASAIASNIAIGHQIPLAVELAIDFVNQAIKNNFKLGHGNGPVNHVH